MTPCVEVTRDASAVSGSAIHRVLCLHLLAHLTESSLRQALDHLLEIYDVQLAHEVMLPPATQLRQIVKSKANVIVKERLPFTFDEE